MENERFIYDEMNDVWVADKFQLRTMVKSSQFSGMALWVSGWDQVWSEDECWEPNPQSDWCYVTMLGDDQKHLIEFSELELLEEDSYCLGCGSLDCQVGR